MNPSVVPSAAEPGNQSVTEMAVMVPGPRAECSRRYALSVAKILKCLLSPERIDRYIVVSATVRSNRADKDSLALRTYIGWGNLAYVYFTRLLLTSAEGHSSTKSILKPTLNCPAQSFTSKF